MKKFELPKMTVIHLSEENVVCTSLCEGVLCSHYYCDDCVSCTGTYECFSVICNKYG